MKSLHVCRCPNCSASCCSRSGSRVVSKRRSFQQTQRGRALLSSTWCPRTLTVDALLHEALVTSSDDHRPHHAQHPHAPEPYMTDTTLDRERAARRSACLFTRASLGAYGSLVCVRSSGQPGFRRSSTRTRGIICS